MLFGDISIAFWNIRSVRQFLDSSGEIMVLGWRSNTSDCLTKEDI
jgi:hypothetical protein